jgi:cysteine desulfurase / selenocysteine lyase
MSSVRDQFPVLSRVVNGRPLVYLDNAATSLKPEVVLEAELHYYRHSPGNIHRGKHLLSEEASELYERARDAVARHLNASAPAEIIFTRNTTEGLNLVAAGLELGPDDEVVALSTEHHSNLLPWMRHARLKAVRASPTRAVDPAEIDRAIGPKTRAVVVAHASNVTGVVQPVAEICARARSKGVVSVVDAAQSVPHLPVDVRSLGCDFLAFSGHKAFGPTGSGALYGRREALEKLKPLLLGGGTVDRVALDGYALRGLPHRLEAGTPNVAGAIGLAAALGFLAQQSGVQAHGEALRQAFAEGLEGQKGLRHLRVEEGPALPMASVVLEGVSLSPDDVAMMLSDRHGVMVRSGFHCAHPLFDEAGLKQGAVRASAQLYNTVEEVQLFCRALADLVRPFAR